MKNFFPLLFLFVGSSLFGQDKPGKLLPSEALILMYHAVDMNPEAKRIDLTLPFMERVITTGLTNDEKFHLGDIYFWNFKPEESKNAFEPFLEETSLRGRAAWQRVMQIEFRAYNKHEEVEKMLKEYRKKFKPDPLDRTYMYGQTYNVASLYKESENHAKVLQLIQEEISSLNYGGAYRSFELPIYFIESYKTLKKQDEAIKILSKARDGLAKTLGERKERKPENAMKYVSHGDMVSGMATPFSEKLGYYEMNEKFEILIGRLDDAIKKFSTGS